MRHRILNALGVTLGILVLTATTLLAVSTLSGSPSLQPEPNIPPEPEPNIPPYETYIGDQPRTVPKSTPGEQSMFGYAFLIYALAAPIIFYSVWRETEDLEE
jgi:hypothetical protein